MGGRAGGKAFAISVALSRRILKDEERNVAKPCRSMRAVAPVRVWRERIEPEACAVISREASCWSSFAVVAVEGRSDRAEREAAEGKILNEG
jgi:hypothetical protein